MKSILFLALSLLATMTFAQDYDRQAYHVTKVVDGDTFWAISKEGVDTKFRLIGMDCPDNRHPNKPIQPFSTEATNYLKLKIDSSVVFLEYDIETKDMYGRDLVYVFDADGSNINAELVRNGLARVTTYVPNVRYESLFHDNQVKAREDKLHMWSVDFDFSAMRPASNKARK